MGRPAIGFVLPTYGKFLYARRAAETFFKHTPDGHVILVDDGSPLFHRQDWTVWKDGLPSDRIQIIRFEENAGLTRGWNVGLRAGCDLGLGYLIAGNSDVLFTPGWSDGLVTCLESGWSLVGPVTNCPGWTNSGRQHVSRFCPDYQVSDDERELARVAETLAGLHQPTFAVESLINGFFQMASADSWLSGMFDSSHFYDPANRMTKNEDELQSRWLKLGRKIGFVPRSYILHYRAVTRGERHKHGDWLRIASEP